MPGTRARGRCADVASNLRRTLFATITVLSIAGCSVIGPQPESAPLPPVTAGQAATKAFLETIATTGLRRWNGNNIHISWFGAPTESDRRVLADTAAWVAAIPGAPGMTVSEDGDTTADITIHAVTTNEWPALLGAGSTFDSVDAAGVTTAEWAEDGVMQHATIVLDVAADQVQRNRTISHELMHALGIGHHSCAGALVYGKADYDPRWTGGRFDAAIVELTYDKRLHTGLHDTQAATIIQPGGEEIPCPEVTYESVRSTSGDLLWCKATGDIRDCQKAADSTAGGPTDGAEVVSWVKNGQLFDYDPSKYVTFSYDGKRILCELPDGGKRTPCEATETGHTVERVDWWTDGKLLHSSQTGN